MDIKEAIYNIVLANLKNKDIRSVYDKALSLLSPVEDEPITVYVRVYSYNSFTTYIESCITPEVFREIVGDRSFYIPVTAYGNEFSLGYRIQTVNGYIEYDTDCLVDLPNLDIYFKLISYEKEMLDGDTSGKVL